MSTYDGLLMPSLISVQYDMLNHNPKTNLLLSHYCSMEDFVANTPTTRQFFLISVEFERDVTHINVRQLLIIRARGRLTRLLKRVE